MCVSVWLLSISLPPSKSVLLYLQVFLSLCSSPCCSASCHCPAPPASVSLCPAVSVPVAWMLQRGKEIHLFSASSLCPSSFSHPTQAGHKDGPLKKAYFVPDNVPVLCTGLLPRWTGWADLGLSWAGESRPSTLVFRPGLPFPMSQLTLTLIIYMQINILKASSAGLFCLPKYSKIVPFSTFPTPDTDST